MPQQLLRTGILGSNAGLYTQHRKRNPLWEDIFILFHLWSVPTCIKVMAEFFLISNSIQGFYDVEGLDFKWFTIDTDFELGWGLENWARLQVKNGILVSASCNM